MFPALKWTGLSVTTTWAQLARGLKPNDEQLSLRWVPSWRNMAPSGLSCAQATEPLFRQEAGPEDLGRWLGLLSLYDVVFVLLSVAVFDFLLED